MKLIFALMLSVFLVSCASVTSQQFGHIDKSAEKIVYIQPGNLRIMSAIKDVFHVNGWQINEYEPDLARYKVHTNTKSTQLLCANELSEIEIELILLDMHERKQVFWIHSKTCDSYTNFKYELDKILKLIK